MKNRYFIKLSYNGKNYNGWQVQPNGITIQGVLNEKLGLLLNEEVNLVGCGRTDTGVHARDFYAHLDIDNEIKDIEKLTKKLNSFLPSDIVIYDIFLNNDKHARFDAISRTYKYYISLGKDPFNEDLSWHCRNDLDIDLMNSAAKILKEYKDFTSFSKLHTDVKTNDCKIEHAFWLKEKNQLIFDIKADRFLRNMVRAIVGTLIEVGRKKMDLDGFRMVIEAKDRGKAGVSVPAHGLFLESVEY